MRRLVAIPVKNEVAVGLLLAGAIYVAVEARQTVVRRYRAEAISAQQSAISQHQQTLSAFQGHGSAEADKVLGGLRQSAVATPQTLHSNSKQKPGQDEVAAEQQASRLPAQKPPKKRAQDTHTRLIVISIPDRQLALLEDGQLVKVYAVAVGASESPSPEGEFTIINHAVDPTYRHEGNEIAPGKDNPLGTRWMGLSLKGYGIHGTNAQRSVGKAASHGCFRMKKKDVEQLYSRVQVGYIVTVRAARDELTASLFMTGSPVGTAAGASKPEAQIASAATPSSTASTTAVEEQ